LEYPEEEEISFEGEEENVLEDLEDFSPFSPVEYPEEEILFEIINQLNFIYLLSALTIRQEDEEKEEE